MCSYGRILSARLRRKNSLPCVKGGGSRKADGGIVILAGGYLVMSATPYFLTRLRKYAKNGAQGEDSGFLPPVYPSLKRQRGLTAPI